MASPPPLQNWHRLFACGKRGGGGSPGMRCCGPAPAPLLASLPGPGFTALLPPSPLSFKEHLVASDFSLWFCWGINAPREKAPFLFQTKLLSNEKDCVCDWEAAEGPWELGSGGQGTLRNSNSFGRAPNRGLSLPSVLLFSASQEVRDTVLGLLPPLKCGISNPI